jgi:hypothetical protein
MKARGYSAEAAKPDMGAAVAVLEDGRARLLDIAKRLGGIGDSSDRTLEQYLASSITYIVEDKLQESLTSLRSDANETRASHRKRVAEWERDEKRCARLKAKRKAHPPKPEKPIAEVLAGVVAASQSIGGTIKGLLAKTDRDPKEAKVLTRLVAWQAKLTKFLQTLAPAFGE